jgi:hypothetical protein
MMDDSQKDVMYSQSKYQIPETFENLGLDEYMSYLQLHYSDNSVYQYRRAVGIVKDYLDKHSGKSIEECIKECIEKCKVRNTSTYLKAYQKWWGKYSG